MRVADPDKEPTLARAFGVRIYNAGILEAADRKLLVQTVDEAEIAIGIQRVLREKVVTVCFLEGHNELPMDNFEFHTHVEGVSNHNHGDASSQHVQMPDHGIGRLRRALEAQGYAARKVVLATQPAVPRECQVLIVANPRTTFLPAESAAHRSLSARRRQPARDVRSRLRARESRSPHLVGQLGVSLPQEAIVDPLSHYASDSEMVAVTGYEAGPITRNLSMTFFPGARPLAPRTPAAGIQVTPLFASSRDSYTRPVAGRGRARRRPGVEAGRSGAVRAGAASARGDGRRPLARRRCRRAAAARGDRRRRRFREQLVPALSGQQRSRALDGPLAGARGAHDERALRGSRCRR